MIVMISYVSWLAHCRDLKKSEDKYIRCMKKASKEEKENLDNALSMLKNLEPTSTSTDDLPEALQDSALQRKSSSQVFGSGRF